MINMNTDNIFKFESPSPWNLSSIINEPKGKKRLVEICNEYNKNLIEDSIDESNFDWKYIGFKNYKLELGTFNDKGDQNEIEVPVSCMHLGNDSKENNLIIIPGMSNQSFAWTLGRINRFRKELLSKYSDIYIFDNSSIGKIPEESSKNHGKSQPEIYAFISQIYATLIYNDLAISKFDILGRSAGGGISLFLSLLYSADSIINTYLACPGFDYGYILDILDSNWKGLSKDDLKDKKVLISHSVDDLKIKLEEKGGTINLYHLLLSRNFDVELQLIRGLNNPDGKESWLNHRIQPDLIEKIIK